MHSLTVHQYYNLLENLVRVSVSPPGGLCGHGAATGPYNTEVNSIEEYNLTDLVADEGASTEHRVRLNTFHTNTYTGSCISTFRLWRKTHPLNWRRRGSTGTADGMKRGRGHPCGRGAWCLDPRSKVPGLTADMSVRGEKTFWFIWVCLLLSLTLVCAALFLHICVNNLQGILRL